MLSSSIPPNTLKNSMNHLFQLKFVTWKRLRLHTWVFSYFPNERLVIMAGLSSLKDQSILTGFQFTDSYLSTRYCGGLLVSEDHLKEKLWVTGLGCVELDTLMSDQMAGRP